MSEAHNSLSPYVDLSPNEYAAGLIPTVNQNRMDEVRRDVEGFPGINNHVSIILAGSDGKLERHSQSPTELVLLQESSLHSQLDSDFAHWYNATHTRSLKKSYLGKGTRGQPEFKIVGGEVPLSYAYSDVNLIYPDRILNTQLVVGSNDVLRKAKRQVLGEMIGDSTLGQRIRKEMGDQLRQYRKALETGEYRRRPIFTIEPPEQFYNEDTNDYRVGFKTSALRSVQRALDILVVRSIRGGSLTIDEAIDMPANTLERLDMLREKGIIALSPEVNEAYSWFLQQYHYAQEEYKKKRELVSIPFDVDDFVRYREQIYSLIEEVKSAGKSNGKK